ncbi:MAG: hypothetical protein A2931_03340 [Candidatus Niyogibacteria bacterium RIFCSPLOWO2_01_FULL_45_48]|uniref:Uncharacterized protein n=1 Tax=Candidatus Niyogibacteria bacterium RIFCSPLOWO2_01_FULL_45_48 TaxID=1801724 RepID=A0A1G2EVK6_9BACT|nr:MAG: hypothetical protein A2931_03340 [Candidatus Niyogibacteria bacterium RIFCSPLOWO2_01_FULL_45_48]
MFPATLMFGRPIPVILLVLILECLTLINAKERPVAPVLNILMERLVLLPQLLKLAPLNVPTVEIMIVMVKLIIRLTLDVMEETTMTKASLPLLAVRAPKN